MKGSLKNQFLICSSKRQAMIIFATFGDSLRYTEPLKKIVAEANEMGVFDGVAPFTERSLSQEWITKHMEFLMKNPRGFGYWMWKPQVVKQCFAHMKDDDILVYADCGCRLNKEGKTRLLEYIEMARKDESANVSFQLPFEEREYNKQIVMDKYPTVDPTSKQLVGGIFVLRKCPKTVEMVNEWANLCEEDAYIYLTDQATPGNCRAFKEHRHDQAIWSVIRKARGTVMIPDETYYENWDENKDKPIHAMRRKW